MSVIKKIVCLFCFSLVCSNVFALGHQLVFEQKANTNFQNFRYEGSLGYYFSIFEVRELEAFNGGRLLAVFTDAAYSFDFSAEDCTKNVRFDLGLETWFLPIFGIFTNRGGVSYSPTAAEKDRFNVFYDLLIHFDIYGFGNHAFVHDEFFDDYYVDNNFYLGAKAGVKVNFFPLNEGRKPEINLYLSATLTFNFRQKNNTHVPDNKTGQDEDYGFEKNFADCGCGEECNCRAFESNSSI